MIERFFTTTFTYFRQVWVGDSSGEVSQGTFIGHIQQSTDENLTQSLGLSFTKTFELWCPLATEVEEGDRLVNGSKEYMVRFKIERKVGNNQHLRLLIEKVDG